MLHHELLYTHKNILPLQDQQMCADSAWSVGSDMDRKRGPRTLWPGLRRSAGSSSGKNSWHSYWTNLIPQTLPPPSGWTTFRTFHCRTSDHYKVHVVPLVDTIVYRHHAVPVLSQAHDEEGLYLEKNLGTMTWFTVSKTELLVVTVGG